MYIIDNKQNVTAPHVCSIVLQDSGCISDTPTDWSIDIPEPSVNIPEVIIINGNLLTIDLYDLFYSTLFTYI